MFIKKNVGIFNNLVTMQNVLSILHLLQRGFPGRKISRELTLYRNTVKLYADRFTACAFSLVQFLAGG